jgi:hypothetical protein
MVLVGYSGAHVAMLKKSQLFSYFGGRSKDDSGSLVKGYEMKS